MRHDFPVLQPPNLPRVGPAMDPAARIVRDSINFINFPSWKSLPEYP